MVKLFLFLLIICGGIIHSIHAQIPKTRVALDAGLNVTTIQHNLPMDGVMPRYTYQYGLSFNSYFGEKQIHWITFGVNISSKGYRQNLEGSLSQFHFAYLSVPVSIAWQPLDFFAAHAGFDFSRCLSIRFNDKQGSREVGEYYSNWYIWL